MKPNFPHDRRMPATRIHGPVTICAVAISLLGGGAWTGIGLGAEGADRSTAFLAGEASLRFQVVIGPDERRGELPRTSPQEIKKVCWELLQRLRGDGVGLTPDTEYRVESYFTVADAFEADGLLVQSVDYLTDLQHKLEQLAAARRGQPAPGSLVQHENDLLHFRDAHNIHVFDEKYMAGAQPSEAGYRWLQSKGVTTVINLREPVEHERELVESLGMRYVHIPWPDEQPPTLDQVQQMLRAVDESPGRVFQHCLRGIGRDMTMASCYMIATQGATAEALIEQGRQEAPRWESDQKRDPRSGEGVQFQLLREFEKRWQARGKSDEGQTAP